MINKVTLIGNLGRDPEMRHLENGSAVVKFSVATNESYKDKSGEWQQITQWHDVVAWRGLAERAERDLKKGGLVYIEGKLSTRKWQDQDGKDRYTTDVVANTMRLLERREDSGSGFNSSFPSAENAPPPASFETNNTTATASKPTATAEPANSEVAKDDLPF